MDLSEILELGLEGCRACDHVPDADIERVRGGRVLWAHYDEEGWGPEHSMGALVALAGGSFAVVYESEDTTGHGCQCSGDIGFYQTLDDALRLGVQSSDRAEAEAAINEDQK